MIEINDLTKIYELGDVQIRALNDIDLKIEEGDVISIMGKSGSGKSTMLRQLGLLDRPTSGEVVIDGENVNGLSDRKRAEMRLNLLGYVFQEYALLPELTALENVYLPGMMIGEKSADYKKRAKELLGIIGLKERINHQPRELSGGELQRVAIARALINKPKYIFADEPCANLDTISAKVVMDTLVRLNKELGVTIIFVSHDPDDKVYAGSHIFLKDGKIVEPYF